MRESRTPLQQTDYDADGDAYVDEDDYTFDCDGLDDTELLAAGRCLRQLAMD